MSFHERFSNIGSPNRIWVVSAIHGQRRRLVEIHKNLFETVSADDRIVYAGNFFCGQKAEPLATLRELVHFRRTITADGRIKADDIVYLRGAQEELFTKLLQLQFAHNPEHIVDWIAQRHPEMTMLLQDFGTSLDEAQRTAREGILNLTRWSNAVKARLRMERDAEGFFTELKRAAFTDHPQRPDENILFVHAGINPRLPLTSQGDSFWWANREFDALDAPYAPFRTVIRGHDPLLRGVKVQNHAISLDGGCGRSIAGKLVCAEVLSSGKIREVIAA